MNDLINEYSVFFWLGGWHVGIEKSGLRISKYEFITEQAAQRCLEKLKLRHMTEEVRDFPFIEAKHTLEASPHGPNGHTLLLGGCRGGRSKALIDQLMSALNMLRAEVDGLRLQLADDEERGAKSMLDQLANSLQLGVCDVDLAAGWKEAEMIKWRAARQTKEGK